MHNTIVVSPVCELKVEVPLSWRGQGGTEIVTPFVNISQHLSISSTDHPITPIQSLFDIRRSVPFAFYRYY